MTPQVSVLMPARNARAYIAEAIRSILGQSFAALEVVVIDDGSTDGSGQIAESVNDGRVRVVPGPCTGVANALNAGLDAARGQVIARCDADDTYVRDRLEWQVKWLDDHPDFGAVCAGFATMTPTGRMVSDLHSRSMEGEITDELRAGTVRTSFCTYAVRAELLRQIGFCRGWFVSAEDIDLQLRLGEIARVWFVPRLSYHYRLHDASITHTQPSAARIFYDQTARIFQQQRLQGRKDDLELGNPPAPPVGLSLPSSSADQIQEILIGRSWHERRAGRRAQSLATGLRACWVRPRNPVAWKSLAALLVRNGAGESR